MEVDKETTKGPQKGGPCSAITCNIKQPVICKNDAACGNRLTLAPRVSPCCTKQQGMKQQIGPIAAIDKASQESS
jgi:hypothetical protein